MVKNKNFTIGHNMKIIIGISVISIWFTQKKDNKKPACEKTKQETLLKLRPLAFSGVRPTLQHRSADCHYIPTSCDMIFPPPEKNRLQIWPFTTYSRTQSRVQLFSQLFSC